MKPSTSPAKRKTIPPSLHLLLVALLACAGAVLFRRSMGIWLTLPFFPLCVALAALLSVRFWQRGLLFLSLTSILNLVENPLPQDAWQMIGMAALLFALTELAVWCFRKRRIPMRVGGAVLLAAGLCCNAFLFGNPFSAYRAQKQLQNYIASHYDTEAGGHTFERIRFDSKTRLYTLTARNQIMPTQPGEICLVNGQIRDSYQERLKEQQMYQAAMKLTAALREAFPDDRFTVVRTGIRDYPAKGQLYSNADPTNYADNVSYCIQMSGKTTYPKLMEGARQYLNVLCEAGIPFDNLVFTCGEGFHYRISVTPAEKVGIYYQSLMPGIYVPRHADHYTHLEQNGILPFLAHAAQTTT